MYLVVVREGYRCCKRWIKVLQERDTGAVREGFGSDGRALAEYTLAKPVVTGSIPACLIKQSNGSLSRMCVQSYMRVQ